MTTARITAKIFFAIFLPPNKILPFVFVPAEQLSLSASQVQMIYQGFLDPCTPS
jgi:hypothetical protein